MIVKLKLHSLKAPALLVGLMGILTGIVLALYYSLGLLGLIAYPVIFLLSFLGLWLISSVVIARVTPRGLVETARVDALSYLSSLVLLVNLPFRIFIGSHPSLASSGNLLSAGVSLLLLVSLTILGWLLFKLVLFTDWLEQIFTPRRAFITLGVFVALYVFGLTYVNILRHGLFCRAIDTAIAGQSFWTTLRGGRFFYNSLEQVSHFAVHASPVYLLLLPFYAIYPKVDVLLLLSNIFLSLSALPLYLIARKRLSPAASLFLAIGYLLAAPIISQMVRDFHEMPLAAFFLLFAFYFFDKEKFGSFLIFIILALTVKEDIGLTVLAFAVYAWLTGRERKWVLSSAILGLAGFLGSLLLIKFFGGQATPFRFGVFRDLGLASGQNIKVALLYRGAYLYGLLQATAFIVPFFSAALVLAVPFLVENLLFPSTPTVVMHYSVVPVGFLFVSCVLGLGKNKVFEPRLFLKRGQIVGGVAVLILLINLSSFDYWLRPGELRPKPWHEAQVAAVNMVPAGASVVSSPDMAHQLTDRLSLETYSGYFKLGQKKPRAQYIILDTHFPSTREYKEESELSGYRVLGLRLKKNKTYSKVFEEEGIIVYKRVKSGREL